MNFGSSKSSILRNSSNIGGFGRSRVNLSLDDYENQKKESLNKCNFSKEFDSFKFHDNTNSYSEKSNNFHNSNLTDFENSRGDVNFSSVFDQNQSFDKTNSFSQKFENSAFNNQCSQKSAHYNNSFKNYSDVSKFYFIF